MNTTLPLGPPVRTRPWPSWPEFDGTDASRLSRAVVAGVGSSADGPLKREFEQQWAAFTGTRRALAVSNGTVSLEIALRALRIGSGDEVIVPPYTFAATATAVLGVSALPVFADIEPETLNVDPSAIEAAITERTRAVIVVHLAGLPVDLDAITSLCHRHGIALIEDAAHAHGARWRGQPVGGFGAFGSWSFQASKNLSSGEGGALTTNNIDLEDAAWGLHNCGRHRGEPWYAHFELGGNHRLTEWQSAVLLGGLERLPTQIERRERAAAVLDRELADITGITPQRRDTRTDVHAHHLYIFRYDPRGFAGLDRRTFVEALNHHGIPASVGYPFPLYKQPLFAEAHFDRTATGWTPGNPATDYWRLRLPGCERACAESVWLPHSLLLADESDMADVVTAVRAVQDVAAEVARQVRS